MAGISLPLWNTLKVNIVTILEAIAAEETIVDAGRNFLVQQDRWRPWVEAQQNIALVNVLVQTVNTNTSRSSNRRNTLDDIADIIDMYSLGEGGEIMPADELAATRLDLLVAQVREGLTRLAETDFDFTEDPEFGFPIDRSETDFTLVYYDQENEQSSGQYAPARWSFTVQLVFVPIDNNVYNDLEELNVSVKDDTLEQFALRFTYP